MQSQVFKIVLFTNLENFHPLSFRPLYFIDKKTVTQCSQIVQDGLRRYVYLL